MNEYLPVGFSLHFDGRPGEYTVIGVTGRGASAVAYLTEYTVSSGRTSERILKEYCPDGLHLKREKDGSLLCGEKDKKAYERGRAAFIAGACRQNELRNRTNLRNETPPLQDILEANNTLYLEVTPFEGKTYDRMSALSLLLRMKISLAAAGLIRRYHSLGYLCLDLKPENFFILTNSSGEIVTDLIEWIDFDSIRSREEIAAGETLAFTEAWAAPEQKNPYQRDQISEKTDIYALGELIFWSLFGRHSRDSEHRGFSEYPFEQVRGDFSEDLKRNSLKNLFTSLFRCTLRSSPKNRCSSMDEVISVLERIVEELSQKEYVIAAVPASPAFFAGREEEMREIFRMLEENRILFLCGLGGIGKSALMRSYCAGYAGSYDIVIYLQYKGNLPSSLADDSQFCIHTVFRMPEESIAEYSDRKMRHLCALSSGKKVLFVLDNYDGAVTDELGRMMRQPWDLVIVSRRISPRCSYPVLNVGAISDEQHLHRLFEWNLGRKIAEEEKNHIASIVGKTAGHTLTLQLIARQISVSGLSVAEAVSLAGRYGFCGIAPEKVDYVRDEKEYHDTIAGIITALFDAGNLSAEKKTLLKFLSLFPVSGIGTECVQDLLGLPSKDVFYGLYREGWLQIEEQNAGLHPVISEAVSLWEWKAEYREAVFSAMRKLTERIGAGKDFSGTGGQATEAAEAAEAAAKRLRYAGIAEDLLEGAGRTDIFRPSILYRDLLYCTVMAMPRYREEYIIEKTEELLRREDAGGSESPGDPEAAEIAGNTGDAKNTENTEAVFRLYENLIFLYAERRDFESCRNRLREAEKFLSKHPGHYQKAMYSDILASYYDAMLDGAYDCGRDEEYELRGALIRSLDRAVFHLRRTRRDGSRLFLARCLLSKANVLMRSAPGKAGRKAGKTGKRREKKIDKILSSAGQILRKYASPHSEICCDFNMSMGWYYTLVSPSAARMAEAVAKARETARYVCLTDLDLIDKITIPCADMFLTAGNPQKAAEQIGDGIRVCEKHGDVLPYMRKKTDLMFCALDIFCCAGDLAGGRSMIRQIDERNRNTEKYGIFREIPEEIRALCLSEEENR